MSVPSMLRFAESPSPSPVPTGLPREIDPTIVTPGYLGLFFFLVLLVALVFLMRSLIRQLRRIDIPEGGTPTHPDAEPPAPSEGSQPPGSSA